MPTDSTPQPDPAQTQDIVLEGLYWTRRRKAQVGRRLRRHEPQMFDRGVAAGRAQIDLIFVGMGGFLPRSLVHRGSVETESEWMRFGQVKAEVAEREIYRDLYLEGVTADQAREPVEAFVWGFVDGWNAYLSENPNVDPITPRQAATPLPPPPPATAAPSPTSPRPEATTPDMKTCPDCAEEVRFAARKCRFCGYLFDQP